MKTGILRFILSLFILLLALPAYSDTPVWKVEKDGYQLFIGGTIHLLSSSDYPLPPTFEQAYNLSQHLVFETDIQKIKDPDYQLKMMSELIFTDGRNLKQLLHDDTYQALEKYCLSKGIPMAVITSFKPGMVSMMLTVLELQQLGIDVAGVDDFYNAKARQDGKGLGQLETAEQQFSFISSMGEGHEDELISYTLEDIKKLPATWKKLKLAWRQGDLKKLKKIALTPLKNNHPSTYNTLLVERNNAWMPQIEALLTTEEVEFVLVGALHLVGNDGLLAQLSAKGYHIERL
ncbi:MAG: TraB/GumN family protein [Betaproteobacteria bacterium]|nr:TraB/GumN family protein [Betaproteobacteria bacterium]